MEEIYEETKHVYLRLCAFCSLHPNLLDTLNCRLFLAVVTHPYNPSIWDVEVGGSRIRVQLQVHRCRTSLGSMRFLSQMNKQTSQHNIRISVSDMLQERAQAAGLWTTL